MVLTRQVLNFDQESTSHQSHWVIFDDQRLALKSFSWLLKHQAELCDVDCGTGSTKIFVWPNAQVFGVPFQNSYLDQIKEWSCETKGSNYHFASKFISVPDRACPLQKLQDKSVAFLFFSFFLISVLSFFLSPQLHCCLLCPLQNLYCSIPDLN